MRPGDKIQDLFFFGLRYARFMGDDFNPREIAELKTKYDYINIFSYNNIPELPGFQAREQKTPIIDLNQNLEDIFAAFRRDTKSGIKRSESVEGLTFAMPDNNFDESYGLYERIKSKDGIKPDIKQDFIDCLFFNAYLGGRMIVSASFYDSGLILRSKHIVSLRKEMGSQNKIAAWATRRILWEVCKYAKARCYRKLDLGGINLEDSVKKGIVDFKLSMGGKISSVFIYRCENLKSRIIKNFLSLFRKNIY